MLDDKDPPDLRVHQDVKELREIPELRDHQVPMANQVDQDYQESKVLPVGMDPQANQDSPVKKEAPD